MNFNNGVKSCKSVNLYKSQVTRIKVVPRILTVIRPFMDNHCFFITITSQLNWIERSIYPHNNFEGEIFPEEVIQGDEITKSKDLIEVTRKYGQFYCLQDYLNKEVQTEVSIIRTTEDKTDILSDNNGKVWRVLPPGFELIDSKIKTRKQNKYKLFK